ncbi:hypothetical protein NDU88_001639 [Pleurodeles waltl]|uniref:Uncharacterized protein n=1 Tax=Pleurodeles waltl TaxID=8319 RepID=A0AAV7RD69_PLEWA|nr:hypothetical protein NDU88_001639 [Pleurodeles waltl]
MKKIRLSMDPLMKITLSTTAASSLVSPSMPVMTATSTTLMTRMMTTTSSLLMKDSNDCIVDGKIVINSSGYSSSFVDTVSFTGCLSVNKNSILGYIVDDHVDGTIHDSVDGSEEKHCILQAKA